MQIINKTPWDTEGLTALVTLMGDTLPKLEKVTFINHQPQPGVKRENQDIYDGNEPYNSAPNQDETIITDLMLELLTPKRVKSRTSPLDRLAYAKDLESYEVPLPVSVVENIVHALHTASKIQLREDRWTRRAHISGSCKCNKALPESPIIAGDTRVKTRPPVTVAQLQRKLYYATSQIEYCEKELASATEQAEKLRDRIEKKKAREAKEQAKLDRIAAKARKLDDLTASLVESERTTP